jgi:DNA-binding CsgD family transcriptional regulator
VRVGPRLLERGKYLGELEAIFSRTLQVPSRCIAIEGPWGSGRTAMINAACDLAGQAGCLVLRARGGEVEKKTPFAVLRRFVESAAAQPSGTDVTRDQARAIEQLMDSAEMTHHHTVEINPLFYSLVIALRSLGPVLLAVDDADISDRETLAVLQYVVRRLENQQIWLLLSARHLHPGVGLRPVDGLLTESETRQFTLEPLQSESVRAMLADYFDEEPDPQFVTACCEATEGTPLFIKALLSSLGRLRILPTAENVGRVSKVPTPKITQFVLGRLSLLPVAASDLLQACAILGDGPDPTVARTLAKIDSLAAERAADAAAQMELLKPGRPIRFTSPLIRWAIYQDIPTARRSQFHARAARLLAEHKAPDAEVAEHLLATEPSGDPKTADWLQAMGRTALTEDNLDLALACLNRALAESPPTGQRGSLNLDLASAEMLRGSPTALVNFRRAIDLGGIDTAEVVRVAVGLLRHLADMPQLRVETLRTIHALDGHLEGVSREARIEFELALNLTSTSVDQRNHEIMKLRKLLDEPGDNGHPMARMAETFSHIHDLAASVNTVDDLSGSLEKNIDVEQLLSSDMIVKKVQTMAYFGLLCADQFVVVDSLLVEAKERAMQRKDLRSEVRVSFLAALSLLWQGSLISAEEEARRGLGLSELLAPLQRSRPSLGLVDALVKQGKIEEATQFASHLHPDEFHDATFRAAARMELGRLMAARDQLDESVEEFLGAGADATAIGLINPAVNSWRADAATVLGALGEWDAATKLADEHLELARAFGAGRAIGIGLRAKAASTSDLDERKALLTEAVELLETSPARIEAACALVELGTVLVETNKKEEARGVLRRGANLASLCGAHPLVEVAGVQLRAAGARPRRLGFVGSNSLTPAELRVVRLAAEGKTNQGIANELYVTVKTVEGHLAKAYRKLGVESRRNLALALAEEDGLLPKSSAI